MPKNLTPKTPTCELGGCKAKAHGIVDRFHTVVELQNLKGKKVCSYHTRTVRQAGLKVFSFEFIERRRQERQATARQKLAGMVEPRPTAGESVLERQLGPLLEQLLAEEGSKAEAVEVGTPGPNPL